MWRTWGPKSRGRSPRWCQHHRRRPARTLARAVPRAETLESTATGGGDASAGRGARAGRCDGHRLPEGRTDDGRGRCPFSSTSSSGASSACSTRGSCTRTRTAASRGLRRHATSSDMGVGRLDACSRARPRDFWATTTCPRRRSALEPGERGGACSCTRTAGRRRSPPPCGATAACSSPASASPLQEVVDSPDAVDAAPNERSDGMPGLLRGVVRTAAVAGTAYCGVEPCQPHAKASAGRPRASSARPSRQPAAQARAAGPRGTDTIATAQGAGRAARAGRAHRRGVRAAEGAAAGLV